MTVPPEYTLVGLLVTAVTALFALYQRGVARTIKAIEATCDAKEQENKWLRIQLESWTQIGRSAVMTAEKLTEAKTA